MRCSAEAHLLLHALLRAAALRCSAAAQGLNCQRCSAALQRQGKKEEVGLFFLSKFKKKYDF
jgi:hypothetical protein